MALSFVIWASYTFNGQNFGLCGKTIASLRRNVIQPLKKMLEASGYAYAEHRVENYLTISAEGHTNDFYMFGGKDEASQNLVQGITLAGCLFDEVALMPYSFVNQATGRCSVDGSKFWFNCNPESPVHWFKTEWIDRAQELNLLYLHFTMDDNLSLSEKVKERYKRMYAGVFYQRYILGLWTIAEGLIYPMFDADNIYTDESRPIWLYSTAKRTISVDYGTTNPCVFLDIWDDGQNIWIDREYRWDSRSDEAKRSGTANRTDSQYGEDMVAFMGDDPARMCLIIVDPSAASFKAELQQRGFWVNDADNDVLNGIRRVGTLIGNKRLKVHESCSGLIAEMNTYAWDDKARMRGEEKPVKVSDHAEDALRYYINSLPDWRVSY